VIQVENCILEILGLKIFSVLVAVRFQCLTVLSMKMLCQEV